MPIYKDYNDYKNEQLKEAALTVGEVLIPGFGTVRAGYNLYKNPSWSNVGNLATAALMEIPIFKLGKAAKLAKAAKAAKDYNYAADLYRLSKIAGRKSTKQHMRMLQEAKKVHDTKVVADAAQAKYTLGKIAKGAVEAGQGFFTMNNNLNDAIKQGIDIKQKQMGGNKQIQPNIIRGGQAIPLGNNFYYMQGRKHKNGGIDVGKDLEVEGGEVMQMGGKDVKVFSSLPFLNGKSPAERVMNGENANQVFNAQENFKKVNKINDDGTKKAEFGKKEIIVPYAPEPYNMPNLIQMVEKDRQRNHNIARDFINGLTHDVINPIIAEKTKLYNDKVTNENIKLAQNDPVSKHIARTNKTPKRNDAVRADTESDYGFIGGNTNDARQQYFDRDKEFTDSIFAIAKQYNINPNTLASRIASEGPIDEYIRINNENVKNETGINPKLDQLYVEDGYTQYGPFWGLDDIGSNLKNGNVHLKNNAEWSDIGFVNEKERPTNSVVITSKNRNGWAGGIHGTAAELAYRKSEMKKRFPNATDEELNSMILAAYNRGIAGATSYINSGKDYKKAYPIYIKLKDKKKFGGTNLTTNKNKDMKQYKQGGTYTLTSNGQTRLRMIPSTGERKRAEFGTGYTNNGNARSNILKEIYNAIPNGVKRRINRYIDGGVKDDTIVTIIGNDGKKYKMRYADAYEQVKNARGHLEYNVRSDTYSPSFMQEAGINPALIGKGIRTARQTYAATRSMFKSSQLAAKGVKVTQGVGKATREARNAQNLKTGREWAKAAKNAKPEPRPEYTTNRGEVNTNVRRPNGSNYSSRTAKISTGTIAGVTTALSAAAIFGKNGNNSSNNKEFNLQTYLNNNSNKTVANKTTTNKHPRYKKIDSKDIIPINEKLKENKLELEGRAAVATKAKAKAKTTVTPKAAVNVTPKPKAAVKKEVTAIPQSLNTNTIASIDNTNNETKKAPIKMPININVNDLSNYGGIAGEAKMASLVRTLSDGIYSKYNPINVKHMSKKDYYEMMSTKTEDEINAEENAKPVYYKYKPKRSRTLDKEFRKDNEEDMYKYGGRIKKRLGGIATANGNSRKASSNDFFMLA